MQKIDKVKLKKLTEDWEHKPLKVAVMKWLCDATVEFNYFVTLTYNVDVTDRVKVEQHGKFFMDRYNIAMGFKKHKARGKYDKTKKAQIVSIIEGDGKFRRFHYHFFLCKPETMSLSDFQILVKMCWFKASCNQGGMLKSDFRPITCFVGLTNYLSKEVTAHDLDAVNLEATHIY